jgi:hypothetical protein
MESVIQTFRTRYQGGKWGFAYRTRAAADWAPRA